MDCWSPQGTVTLVSATSIPCFLQLRKLGSSSWGHSTPVPTHWLQGASCSWIHPAWCLSFLFLLLLLWASASSGTTFPGPRGKPWRRGGGCPHSPALCSPRASPIQRTEGGGGEALCSAGLAEDSLAVRSAFLHTQKCMPRAGGVGSVQ